MLYQILPVAALISTAFAVPALVPQCSQTSCFDGSTDCTVEFLPCTDACQLWATPKPEWCPGLTLAPAYSAVAPITVDDCSTRTVCADYVNECGILYGGCFADCTPWPTFSEPPCPSTAAYLMVDFTEVTLSTRWEPTDFSDNTVTVGIPTEISSVSTNFPEIPTDFTSVPTEFPPGAATGLPDIIMPIYATITPSPSSDCHTETVCQDFVNDCGQTYGGCFSACTPWPTFTPPPCTSATEEICADNIKACTDLVHTYTYFLTWGGCYDPNGPVPTFVEPPCPEEAETTVWIPEPTEFITEMTPISTETAALPEETGPLR